MILVDTSAWFAVTVTNDVDHLAARRWLMGNTEPLITTDYILDETLTLLKARGEYQRAIRLGQNLFNEAEARLYYLTTEDIMAAWRMFLRFSDKDWSFTDCTSKVVMEKLGMTTAFTFDHHFRQFGGITVVP